MICSSILGLWREFREGLHRNGLTDGPLQPTHVGRLADLFFESGRHFAKLFAKDIESDLYAAIDAVTKKIEQQIRKRHGKFKVIKHKDAAKVKALRRSTAEE